MANRARFGQPVFGMVSYAARMERKYHRVAAAVFSVPNAAHRAWRENTAWNRVLVDLGRIFSFPTLPPAREMPPEFEFWLFWAVLVSKNADTAIQ